MSSDPAEKNCKRREFHVGQTYKRANKPQTQEVTENRKGFISLKKTSNQEVKKGGSTDTVSSSL